MAKRTHQHWMNALNIGDQVAVHDGGTLRRLECRRVERITPTRMIRLRGSSVVYNPNGEGQGQHRIKGTVPRYIDRPGSPFINRPKSNSSRP